MPPKKKTSTLAKKKTLQFPENNQTQIVVTIDANSLDSPTAAQWLFSPSKGTYSPSAPTNAVGMCLLVLCNNLAF